MLLVAARVLKRLDQRKRAKWTRQLALACLATLADRVQGAGEAEGEDTVAAAEEERCLQQMAEATLSAGAPASTPSSCVSSSWLRIIPMPVTSRANKTPQNQMARIHCKEQISQATYPRTFCRRCPHVGGREATRRSERARRVPLACAPFRRVRDIGDDVCGGGCGAGRSQV